MENKGRLCLSVCLFVCVCVCFFFFFDTQFCIFKQKCQNIYTLETIQKWIESIQIWIDVVYEGHSIEAIQNE